jgi:hypothetical protein
MSAVACHPTRPTGRMALVVAAYVTGTLCFGIMYSMYPEQHFRIGATIFAPHMPAVKLLAMLQHALAMSGVIALWWALATLSP